ncbi:MAG TPA: contractile injection system protein, VgrG/Pvc8 family [Pseudomonas sp.]|uniref:contractile injection system protein, VgrG/Pvc8 family n=1 Tax=Pseudomonas sp. TaxID=306 RepID=UPI002EDA132C
MTFTGVEVINKPFSFEVQAASLHGELDLQQCLFSDVYLSSKLPGVGFHAQIQSIGRSNTGPGPVHYQISLGPRMKSLAHRYNQRIFQDLPAKSIIRKVLREHGIHEDGYAFELTKQYDELAFCAQHGETDLQLVERLCQQEGIHYYFEHSLGNHMLVFSDEMRHNPRTSAVHFGTQSARGEISRFTVCPSAVVATGERTALRVKGASALHFLRTGMQLPMTGHQDPRCNQAWLLTEIHHRGLQPAFKIGTIEPVYLNAFSAVQAALGMPAKKPKAQTKPSGIQRALVVGALFDEALRDHEGRIKVRFDWGHQGDGSRYNDCWLPIDGQLDSEGVQWWGGMEVVVSFVDDDPDQPVIVDYVCDPDISPHDPDRVSGEIMHKPATKQHTITTRLDRQHFLGDTQQIYLDDLTLHLDSSNELNFSVGSSHVTIGPDGVTLSSPNIVLSTQKPADDKNANPQGEKPV